MSRIGQLERKLWPKMWSKTWKNDPKILGHANISRNMKDREFDPKAKL